MLKFILLFHWNLWQIDLFTSPILLFHLLHVTLLKSQVYIIVSQKKNAIEKEREREEKTMREKKRVSEKRMMDRVIGKRDEENK